MTEKIKDSINSHRCGVPKAKAMKLVKESYLLGYAKAVEELSAFGSVDVILKSIEEELGITLSQMKETTKSEDIMEARKIAIKLLYSVLGSSTKVAKVLERDHATILHHKNNFNSYLMSCPSFRVKYKKVNTKIKLYEEREKERTKEKEEAENLTQIKSRVPRVV